MSERSHTTKCKVEKLKTLLKAQNTIVVTNSWQKISSPCLYLLSFTCLHVTFLHERAIGICDICQLVQDTEILSSFYINPSRRSQVLFIFSPVLYFRKRFRQHSRHQAVHRNIVLLGIGRSTKDFVTRSGAMQPTNC